MQVNILEAKNRLSELIKCAQAGQNVVIANRGQPVIRLMSIDAADSAQTKVGSGAALSAWLHNRPDRQAVRDNDQIERDIQAERAAWD